MLQLDIFSSAARVAALVTATTVADPAVVARASVTPPSPSSADEVDLHMQAASEKFEAGDFEGALVEFEAAYAIEPDPNFVYNMGRVLEESGRLQEAVDRYRQFVTSSGVTLELRAKANERIKILEDVIATARLPNADESVLTTAQPGVQASPPPPEPAEHNFDSTPNRGRSLRLAGYTLLGVGGAGLVAGAIVGGLATRDASDLEGENDPERRADLRDQGRAKALGADILLGTSAGFALLGVVLTAVGVVRGRRESSRATLGPSLASNRAGLVLRARF